MRKIHRRPHLRSWNRDPHRHLRSSHPAADPVHPRYRDYLPPEQPHPRRPLLRWVLPGRAARSDHPVSAVGVPAAGPLPRRHDRKVHLHDNDRRGRRVYEHTVERRPRGTALPRCARPIRPGIPEHHDPDGPLPLLPRRGVLRYPPAGVRVPRRPGVLPRDPRKTRFCPGRAARACARYTCRCGDVGPPLHRPGTVPRPKDPAGDLATHPGAGCG
ncbi:hypothetical protein DSECCO2_419800 [anaerobic digester metagenome]